LEGGNDKRVNTMLAKTELIYISIHTAFGYSVRQGTLKVSLGNRSYTLLKIPRINPKLFTNLHGIENLPRFSVILSLTDLLKAVGLALCSGTEDLFLTV
jgi:hypothetical protein